MSGTQEQTTGLRGKNIERVAGALGVSEQDAYGMLLIASVLTDLNPWDERVADMILRNRGGR